MIKIFNQTFSIKQLICLIVYYGLARFLPVSYTPILGRPSKWLRYHLCRCIFVHCGTNVNIERLAWFGSGHNISIGNNSGLGVNCNIPSNIIIGDNVMMGPNCYILGSNHKFDRVDIPMNQQGMSIMSQTIIENDVWIGRDVLFTPGRHIKTGSIIGAGCVLCKDFPEYSVVGGNPSQLIKSRK